MIGLRIVFTILMLLALAYIAIGVFLYVKQRSFIYFPTPLVEHPFKKIVFQNGSEQINVVHVSKNNPQVIVYFGGNAESVAHTAHSLSQNFPGHDIYLMDYRGYGESSGEPTEQGIKSDALLLIDSVAGKYQQVIVMGRSLGTGVAVYAASQRQFDKLILITPYDSIERVAQRQYPIYPLSLLLKDKYNSLELASKIAIPTLVLTAELDTVIPTDHTQRLVQEIAPNLIQQHVFLSTNHNSISEHSNYYPSIVRFLTTPKIEEK